MRESGAESVPEEYRNPENLKGLVFSYQENLQRYLTKKLHGTPNPEEIARDLAQETMMLAVKNISQFKGEHGEKSLQAWLFAIASNELNMYYRRTKNDPLSRAEHTADMLTEKDYELEWEIPDPGEDQLGKLLLEERGEKFDQALAKLGSRDQKLIRLSLENMPMKQIGETLGMSLPSVKSELFRARRKLAENLGVKSFYIRKTKKAN